jgi:heat-inducible transcriptional repressor
MQVEPLAPRRGRILKHIIEDYVVTAQPVSSDALVRKYVPAVSSATVRNEMAALEESGYLYHPHTSAGRVPSDRGYRYYVEWLMGDARLSEMEERTISHQFHQVELDVGEWLSLAASLLASRVQSPVVIGPPAAQVSRLRRIDLVRTASGVSLLVVMLTSGEVHQQVLRTFEDLDPLALAQVGNEWTARLADRSAAEIREIAKASVHADLLDTLARVLEETDRHHGRVRVEGLSYIAAQPDFGTSERLQQVVETLERRGVLVAFMEPLLRAEGVYVAIGEEQPLEHLRECSAVLATYGRADDLLGVVGVIGPTRLPYWRAVPMVQYVAAMLDRLLEDTFLSNEASRQQP